MFRANVQIFSVNICGKASNSFRFDSDCYALLLSLLMYVTTLTQFRLIFHVLLLLYFFFKSREADIHFYLCSIIPFHYKKRKRSIWVQKLFRGRPASIHIDKWWICSNSCFHNEVKWNVRCSKVPATPIQKFTQPAYQGCFLLLCFDFVFVFI